MKRQPRVAIYIVTFHQQSWVVALNPKPLPKPDITALHIVHLHFYLRMVFGALTQPIITVQQPVYNMTGMVKVTLRLYLKQYQLNIGKLTWGHPQYKNTKSPFRLPKALILFGLRNQEPGTRVHYQALMMARSSPVNRQGLTVQL